MSSNATLTAVGASADETRTNYATSLTNVFYLLILIPLLLKGKHRFWPEILAILGAFWFSTVYHTCRDVGPHSCPHNSDVDDTGRMDLMAAYIAVGASTSPFVYCYSSLTKVKDQFTLRVHPNYRALWFISMTLLTFTLLTWTSPNQEYLAFSFIGVFNMIVIFYCGAIRFRFLTARTKNDNGVACLNAGVVFGVVFLLSIVILCIGGLFRILLWSDAVDSYTTYHSLWHICSAVSGLMMALLLPSIEEIQALESGGYSNLSQVEIKAFV